MLPQQHCCQPLKRIFIRRSCFKTTTGIKSVIQVAEVLHSSLSHSFSELLLYCCILFKQNFEPAYRKFFSSSSIFCEQYEIGHHSPAAHIALIYFASLCSTHHKFCFVDVNLFSFAFQKCFNKLNFIFKSFLNLLISIRLSAYNILCYTLFFVSSSPHLSLLRTKMVLKQSLYALPTLQKLLQ